MDTTGYISVSKACSMKDYSVKKVLTFLADRKVIPKESQRKGAIFHLNKYINIKNGTTKNKADIEFNVHLTDDSIETNYVHDDECEP